MVNNKLGIPICNLKNKVSSLQFIDYISFLSGNFCNHCFKILRSRFKEDDAFINRIISDMEKIYREKREEEARLWQKNLRRLESIKDSCSQCNKRTAQLIKGICIDCHYKSWDSFRYSDDIQLEGMNDSQTSCFYYILAKAEQEDLNHNEYDEFVHSFCSAEGFPSLDWMIKEKYLTSDKPSLYMGEKGLEALSPKKLKKVWLELEPTTRKELLHSNIQLAEHNLSKILKHEQFYTLKNGTHPDYRRSIPTEYWIEKTNKALGQYHISIPENWIHASLRGKITANVEPSICRLGINPAECMARWKQSHDTSFFAHKDVLITYKGDMYSIRIKLSVFGDIYFERKENTDIKDGQKTYSIEEMVDEMKKEGIDALVDFRCIPSKIKDCILKENDRKQDWERYI